jgi:glutathione S-transferase
MPKQEESLIECCTTTQETVMTSLIQLWCVQLFQRALIIVLIFNRLKQNHIIYEGNNSVTQGQKYGIRAVLNVLNDFLEGREYMAGNNLTIADFAIIGSLSSFHVGSPKLLAKVL